MTSADTPPGLNSVEESIRIEHNAINATPKNHPDRALHLSRLGNKLYELYLRTKSMTDLEEAIRIGQAAVDAAPEDSADRAGYLTHLGVRFHSRFDRTGSMSDLETSIRIAQAFVDATPENDPGRVPPLQNLGTGFQDLFLKTGSMTYLEKAIQFGQAAVDAAKNLLCPSDQVICLDCLGKSFLLRYQRTASADDLDKAIFTGQAVISTLSEDDPNGARCFTNLGIGFLRRSQRTWSMDDRQEAFTHFTEALYHSSSPEFDCLLGGRYAAYMASESGQYDQGAQYLTECLDLLPMIVLRSNSHEDLQYILREVSGLGSLAALAFLRAGRSALEALQALEKSRGVISSFVIDSRFDVSILEHRHPDLWSRYCYLRECIASSTLLSTASNSATLPNLPGGHYSVMTLARSIMIKELDVIKHLIRKQPEFERFELPPREVELHGLANCGPVVSFNVTPFGSHAFLITEDNIRVLPLPELLLKDIQEHVSRDMGGNRSRRDAELVSPDGSSQFEGDSHATIQTASMRWIWDVAVKPVLRELGLLWQHKPPPVLPCLWWVGGGLTALLPLHAAGNHGPGSTENTMSHIVSSYAPSLTGHLQQPRVPTF